jgi:hypothetical protein
VAESDVDSEFEFVSEPPKQGGPPQPFSVTMHELDGGAPVTERFLAKPPRTVSFGVLIADTDEATQGEALAAFRDLLVEENSDPDGEDDDRTEYERFAEFITDRKLLITDTTLRAILDKLQGMHAEGPTKKPGASGRTTSSGPGGSVARRRRRR